MVKSLDYAFIRYNNLEHPQNYIFLKDLIEYIHLVCYKISSELVKDLKNRLNYEGSIQSIITKEHRTDGIHPESPTLDVSYKSNYHRQI